MALSPRKSSSLRLSRQKHRPLQSTETERTGREYPRVLPRLRFPASRRHGPPRLLSLCVSIVLGPRPTRRLPSGISGSTPDENHCHSASDSFASPGRIMEIASTSMGLYQHGGFPAPLVPRGESHTYSTRQTIGNSPEGHVKLAREVIR